MKRKLNNIIAYLQGWYRYYLYYSKLLYGIDLSYLIRLHIYQQIVMRINSMNRECYYSGSCIICGCKTTALQMANRACEGDCYPKMLSKEQWKELKSISEAPGYYIQIGNYGWRIENDKFEKI